VAVADWADISRYFTELREGAGFPIALFAVLTVVFCAARRKLSSLKGAGATAVPALSVFQRPYSAALTVALVFASSPFFEISTTVRQLIFIAILVPMIRLAQPVVSPSIAAWMYTLCVLFAVETLRQAFAGVQVFGQAILVAESLAAIVAAFWMRRHYRVIIAERGESSHLFLRLLRLVVIITLMLSLVAGAAGYLRLSRLLTPGILIGGVLGLATFTYLRVTRGVLALAFRVWPLRLLRMVEHHRDLLERKIYRVLAWGAILAWSVRYLGYLGLLDPVCRWRRTCLRPSSSAAQFPFRWATSSSFC